jgi:hypothetical protein
MPGRATDFMQSIKEILHHVAQPPPEAATPLAHYQRSSDDLWNLREYVGVNLAKRRHSKPVLNEHMQRLHGMVLVHFIESFERFLKETAAVCVDALGEFVLDDRFNAFRVQGSALAAHFGTDTLGKSLCESIIWLDCDEINARFRKLLADPFEDGDFLLFPKATQQPAAERGRYEVLNILWQLRHTIVHNVGVVTQSDAIKLRLLVREQVRAGHVLAPSRDDLRHARRFLDQAAKQANDRVGRRLADLLTTLVATNPILFDPQDTADRLTRLFGVALTVAGAAGTLPPS